MRGHRQNPCMVRWSVVLCIAMTPLCALSSVGMSFYPPIALQPAPNEKHPAAQDNHAGWRIVGAPQQPEIDLEAATERVLPDPPEKKFPLSLNTRYQEHRGNMPGIKFNPAQPNTYWDVKVKSEIANTGLSTESELAFSYFDPDARDGFGDAEDRSMKLGVSGSQGPFKYGTRYRAVGKDFLARTHKEDKNLDKDQDQWEVWSSWWSGRFGIRAAAVTKQNNLDDEPDEPRIREQFAQTTLTYQWSDWPNIGYSFSYGNGTNETTYEPDGYRPIKGPMQSLDSSLYYSSDSWYASINSYRIDTEDNISNRGYELTGHSVSASYYPSANFNISPFVGIDGASYDEDNSRSQNRSLSVSLRRAFPKRRTALKGQISYYDGRNDTWGLDYDGVYADAGMTWTWDKDKPNNRRLGLYVTYNRYRDRIYDGGDVDDVTAWIVFRHGQKRRSWSDRSDLNRYFDPYSD